MHADSLLIHLNFSSKLMITWLHFFGNPLLIRFQTDRKLTFDPVRTNEGGSKVSFRTIHSHVIDKLFENPLLVQLHSFELDQKWVFDQFESGSKVGFRTNSVTWSLISKRNWTGSKVSWHAYASRDSPPSHSKLDQKLDPLVQPRQKSTVGLRMYPDRTPSRSYKKSNWPYLYKSGSKTILPYPSLGVYREPAHPTCSPYRSMDPWSDNSPVALIQTLGKSDFQFFSF